MGLAAPQIGIDRAAAIVRPPGDADPIALLNPQVIEELTEVDEQYKGCLSFFDMRIKVLRPLTIHVEHHEVDGTTRIRQSFPRSEGISGSVCQQIPGPLDVVVGSLVCVLVYDPSIRPPISAISDQVFVASIEVLTMQGADYQEVYGQPGAIWSPKIGDLDEGIARPFTSLTRDA